MPERVLALDRLCDRMDWLDEAIADAIQTGVLTVRDIDSIKGMRDALACARAYCKEAICKGVLDTTREAYEKGMTTKELKEMKEEKE